jgi:hypothetical protein
MRLRGFQEVVLSPFDRYRTAHPGAWPPKGGGQLRFNTEPEIWDNWNGQRPFFSISALFRKERFYNILRRRAFYIVDYYAPGDVSDMLELFEAILKELAEGGLLRNIPHLPIAYDAYNPETDAPANSRRAPELVVTTGYSAENSFFDLDDSGRSTRNEIYLATDAGLIEIAALGMVGNNGNPEYGLDPPLRTSCIPKRLAGCGIGLERLLLSDRILGMLINDTN